MFKWYKNHILNAHILRTLLRHVLVHTNGKGKISFSSNVVTVHSGGRTI